MDSLDALVHVVHKVKRSDWVHIAKAAALRGEAVYYQHGTTTVDAVLKQYSKPVVHVASDWAVVAQADRHLRCVVDTGAGIVDGAVALYRLVLYRDKGHAPVAVLFADFGGRSREIKARADAIASLYADHIGPIVPIPGNYAGKAYMRSRLDKI